METGLLYQHHAIDPFIKYWVFYSKNFYRFTEMLLKLNRMRKGATVLLACLVLSFHSFAQSYAFKHITTNDGLVQTDVTDIKQDKKGNIWIGTNGGLSVFDGKRFTRFSK